MLHKKTFFLVYTCLALLHFSLCATTLFRLDLDIT